MTDEMAARKEGIAGRENTQYYCASHLGHPFTTEVANRMGYVINALIARREIFEHSFPGIRPEDIAGLALAPFAIVPFTDEFDEKVYAKGVKLGMIDSKAPGEAEEVRNRLAPDHANFAFAFVTAHFFGGAGNGEAIVFDRGEIRRFDAPDTIWPNSNISQALKALGVPEDLVDKRDAFDVVGLGRHRRTEDWLGG